ncbi:MAG: RNA-binding protein [Bdellovibrionales bacterium]|nr:RNA-binding protein [Bdellovibrionales bacterium]
MAKKLYVGNLSYEVTEDELTQAFTRCGQVSGVQIIKDRDSGRSKGFAFVEMADDEEAEQAISTMTGQDLKGRPLTVDHARERSSRGGGGSRGGFRRGR